MFRFKRTTTPNQSPEPERKQAEGLESKLRAFEVGQQLAQAWADEINQRCTAHLREVATSRPEWYEKWDEAERTGDLQTVIEMYCGAVDGTEDFTNKLFQPFEQKARELNVWEMIEHVKIRKLQHLLQLRNFFEYRLKVNLIPAGSRPARKKLRQDAFQMLDPEFSKQF
jgi:hypothetical protein